MTVRITTPRGTDVFHPDHVEGYRGTLVLYFWGPTGLYGNRTYSTITVPFPCEISAA